LNSDKDDLIDELYLRITKLEAQVADRDEVIQRLTASGEQDQTMDLQFEQTDVVSQRNDLT